MLEYKEKMPETGEWKALRENVGWTLHGDEDFARARSNSLFGISVYSRDEIVGMGRVVGDGIICFYIQDLVVKTEYRGRGIGKRIMELLLNYIIMNAAPNAVIGLFSSKGNEGFYSRFGFSKRDGTIKGFGMQLLEVSPFMTHANPS